MPDKNKVLEGLYKYFVWIVIVASIIAYVAYRTLQFDGDFESVATSPNTWLNIAFSIWLHINILQGAVNSAISGGLDTASFRIADKINNEIIQSITNEMTPFREYVKTLNANERLKLEEDFIFKCGVLSYDELTEKQKKQFKKLKPIIHDIYGFNLPLYYELTREGKLVYKGDFVKGKGMTKKRLMQVVNGVLLGLITVNVIISVEGLKEVWTSVAIMVAGLILTYIMSFIQPYFKLSYEIPKVVLLKATLFNGYVEFKNGTHQLLSVKTSELDGVGEKSAVEEKTPTTPEYEAIKEPIAETH